MNLREELKKRVLFLDEEGAFDNELEEILDDGVEVIERNLDAGNINEVDDKVLRQVAYKMIERYWSY